MQMTARTAARAAARAGGATTGPRSSPDLAKPVNTVHHKNMKAKGAQQTLLSAPPAALLMIGEHHWFFCNERG